MKSFRPSQAFGRVASVGAQEYDALDLSRACRDHRVSSSVSSHARAYNGNRLGASGVQISNRSQDIRVAFVVSALCSRDRLAVSAKIDGQYAEASCERIWACLSQLSLVKRPPCASTKPSMTFAIEIGLQARAIGSWETIHAPAPRSSLRTAEWSLQ